MGQGSSTNFEVLACPNILGQGPSANFWSFLPHTVVAIKWFKRYTWSDDWWYKYYTFFFIPFYMVVLIWVNFFWYPWLGWQFKLSANQTRKDGIMIYLDLSIIYLFISWDRISVHIINCFVLFCFVFSTAISHALNNCNLMTLEQVCANVWFRLLLYNFAYQLKLTRKLF